MGSPGRAGQQSLVFFPPSLFHTCAFILGPKKSGEDSGVKEEDGRITFVYDGTEEQDSPRRAHPNYPKTNVLRFSIWRFFVLRSSTFKLSRTHAATLVSFSPQDTQSLKCLLRRTVKRRANSLTSTSELVFAVIPDKIREASLCQQCVE